MTKKLTFEFVYNEFKKVGYTLLETEYINNHTKMKYLCTKHPDKVLYITYHNFQRGRRCPYCKKEKLSNLFRKSHQDFLAEKDDTSRLAHIDVLETYKKGTTKIKLYCNKHGVEFYRSPNTLLKGYGCDKCALEKRLEKLIKPEEEYIKEFYEQNKTLKIIGRYKGVKQKIKVQCLVDGHIWNPIASTLIGKSKSGCSVCSNRVTMLGINDLNTTHPHIFNWLLDKTKLYTHGSTQKAEFKCPDCGYIFESSILNATQRNIRCQRCGDCTSFGEKYLMRLLDILGINYKTQYTPRWSNKKIYDFYLTDINSIIEVHGLQHYKYNCFDKIGGRNLEQEQKNDKFKMENAIKNGINKYIILDCRVSSVDFIKNSILNSELSQMYELSNINWMSIEEDIYKSKIREAVELWNNGVRIKDISEVIKKSRPTVSKYLQIGNEAGLCKYTGVKPGETCKRSIVCKTTKTVFDSIVAAKNFYHITIHMECKISGKLIDGTPLQWEYFDKSKDYIGYTYIA